MLTASLCIDDGRIIADMNAHELVSSTILTETGIREPLYVTALKYAGVKVTREMLPGYITTLNTESSSEALARLAQRHSWQTGA